MMTIGLRRARTMIRRKLTSPAVCMKAVCLTGVAVMLWATPAAATDLTFDIDATRPTASNLPMDQTYGDRVTALIMGNAAYGVGPEGFTPNITVSYEPSTSPLERWNTGYGDLVNVLFNQSDGDTLLGFTLTADAGFQAVFYGLDLGGFSGDNTVASIIALVDGNEAFRANNFLVRGNNTHSTVAFAVPLVGNSISFRVDMTGLGGASDNIGIDNVRFGQIGSPPGAIPEPATWAFMILGFGGIGSALRRRRRGAPATA